MFILFDLFKLSFLNDLCVFLYVVLVDCIVGWMLLGFLWLRWVSLHAADIMLPVLEHTLRTWRDPFNLGPCAGLARYAYPKNLTSGRKSFISCSSSTDKELHVPSDIQLANSKVIYSVASATGHNQVSGFLLFLYGSIALRVHSMLYCCMLLHMTQFVYGV